MLSLATAKEGAAADLILNGSGTVTCPALSGVKAHPSGKGCIMGGEFTFGSISLTNGALIEVAPYDGSSTTNTGNLVLRATGTILIDESSRILAKGAGFRGRKCDEGEAPALFPLAGGRGGCSVRDSGGGGAHIGRGGKGTRDCSATGCTFPLHWEEDCGDLVSGACQNVANVDACYNGNATPDVSGQSYYHSLYLPFFGAAGGDKGCRDGDGQGTWDLRAGDGGGRIVLFAGNGTNTGLIDIRGRVQSDGFRGCSAQNDSAGGGAGGTVFIVGDEVRVGRYARISARGGRGGDSQPKALECAGGAAPSTLPTCVAAGANNCDPDGAGPNAATNGDCITVGAYGLRCVSPTMHLGDLDPATLLTCVTPGGSSCDPDGAGSRSATDGDCIHLGSTLGARCLDRALRSAACGSGQVCRVFSDPWTGAPSTTAREYARCEPSTCTPCGPSDVCPSGHTCQTIGGDFNKVCLPTRTTSAPTCATAGFNNCNPSTGAAGTGGDCIALGGYGSKCPRLRLPRARGRRTRVSRDSEYRAV
jgi:hypothetical protein